MTSCDDGVSRPPLKHNIFFFLFWAGVLVVCYKWPSFIDRIGAKITVSITEKRESVRENGGIWFRQFWTAAGGSVCAAEQATYDSLHVGDQVPLHYFPLPHPFSPIKHFSPCAPMADFFGSNPDFYRREKVVFGSLAAILFVWRVLPNRRAGWLLVLAPWFVFVFVGYGLTPRAEPAPSQPRPAKAVVRSISTIEYLITEGGLDGPLEMALIHPYQLVQLEFTPAGATVPVVALDAVDLNSIANLAPKEIVDIDYDAANPRIARIHGGTRNFPKQTLLDEMLVCGGCVGLGVALFILIRLRLLIYRRLGLFRRAPRSA